MRKIQKGLAVAAIVAAVMVGLGRSVWESYQTSQREAAIFASLSATAFEQGFCDRALRLAIAGLPQSVGASPISFRSPQLEGDLSFFGSQHNCYFQSALAGHSSLVSGAAFSTDGSRILTASWDETARIWHAGTGAPRSERYR
jgi:hypothetical protein